MNTIRKKQRLSENVYRMELEAPLIAKNRKAGQFVILMVDAERGERIPLTIADADADKGTITIIFQTVGATTMKLAQLNEGDALPALLGPLGKPTQIVEVESRSRREDNSSSSVQPSAFSLQPHAPRRVVCVGGGIGVAPMHPIAQAFKAAGNDVTIIMGARNESLFVMEDEMSAIAGDKLILVTDDGSKGRKGLVTEPLKEIIELANNQNNRIDEVVAIGPPVMMKFCALTTKPYGIKTTVSLNTIMIDGTGMCGGCRVTVGGQTKFVCVDGPEFDGHQVDWDQMLSRMTAFRPQEVWAKEHACNMLRV